MPFSRVGGETDWWVVGPLNNFIKSVPTKREAFYIALEHNKKHGVNAVFVHGLCMKHGGWEETPE
jgi:hypothetical protein